MHGDAGNEKIAVHEGGNYRESGNGIRHFSCSIWQHLWIISIFNTLDILVAVPGGGYYREFEGNIRHLGLWRMTILLEYVRIFLIHLHVKSCKEDRYLAARFDYVI